MNQNGTLKGEKIYCPPILQRWTKTKGNEGLENSMWNEGSVAKISDWEFSLWMIREGQDWMVCTHTPSLKSSF